MLATASERLVAREMTMDPIKAHSRPVVLLLGALATGLGGCVYAAPPPPSVAYAPPGSYAYAPPPAYYYPPPAYYYPPADSGLRFPLLPLRLIWPP